MTLLCILVYNLLLFPLIFAMFHIQALWDSKTRRGVVGRYQSQRLARRFRRLPENAARELFLIHCASMGEFEHIKPFLRKLREKRPESRTVVMFFSPSGYENVREVPGVDLFLYAPFDGWLPVWRLFRTLRPRTLIIAKYDAWPNQIWMANWMGIPRFLINAQLYATSSRLRWPARWVLPTIYRRFDRILCTSETDRQNYAHLALSSCITVVGDTKYDQVIFRSEESRKKAVLPPEFYRGKPVFVAGSTWPEDEAQLIPAIKSLWEKHRELRVIICPHEPGETHLAQLEVQLHPLPVVRYSRLNPSAPAAVVLIDQIGLLANLYSVAAVAYVGGGFKQNVHNVLEPAVYGIPVLFGPVNQKSHEAQLLRQSGGGVEVASGEEILQRLDQFFSDEAVRRQVGKAARDLVESHRGATERTVQAILALLDTAPPLE